MSFKDFVISILPKTKYENIEKYFPMTCFLPVYHAVSDEKLPHLKNIIQYKNQKQFREDLDYLSKHFQFMDWEDFKRLINNELRPSKKVALLTFDDGLREFNDVIAPILIEKGIYAINFINPKFIDNQALMFRCKASLMIEKLKFTDHINADIYKKLNLTTSDKKRLQQKILGISYKEQNLLDETAKLLEVDFSEYLSKNKPYLSLKEIDNLKNKGFGFGAHSWSHPLYNELDVALQIKQTQKSLAYLKEHSLQNDAFAFPFTDFGVKKVFFDRIFEKEKDLFCTFGCAGLKWDSIKKNYQRTPMENGLSAKDTIKNEMAYYNLKKLINKNVIKR